MPNRNLEIIDERNPDWLRESNPKKAAALYIRNLQILIETKGINYALKYNQDIGNHLANMSVWDDINLERFVKCVGVFLFGVATGNQLFPLYLKEMDDVEEDGHYYDAYMLVREDGDFFVMMIRLLAILCLLYLITPIFTQQIKKNTIKSSAAGILTKLVGQHMVNTSAKINEILDQGNDYNPQQMQILGILYDRMAYSFSMINGQKLAKQIADCVANSEKWFLELAVMDLDESELLTLDFAILHPFFKRAAEPPNNNSNAKKSIAILSTYELLQRVRDGDPKAIATVDKLVTASLTGEISGAELDEMTVKDKIIEKIKINLGSDCDKFEEIMRDPINWTMIFNPFSTIDGLTFDETKIDEGGIAGWSNKRDINPHTGKSFGIHQKRIPNRIIALLLDYLYQGGKIREFPGFVNPATKQPYIKPLLDDTGGIIEGDGSRFGYPVNLLAKQLMEAFPPMINVPRKDRSGPR